MIQMYKFENYTLVVYETSKEYHGEVPDHRFVAYLKEIPEASLHEYGPTQEEAFKNLRVQFEAFANEAKEKGVSIPDPEKRDEEEFSGRIVLRMPPWLHRQVDYFADEEGLSTNSYIVNRLIRTVTMEEVVGRLVQKQESWFKLLGWTTSQEPVLVQKKTSLTLLRYAKEGPKLEYDESQLKRVS